jgi:LPS-assembly lipoprotein
MRGGGDRRAVLRGAAGLGALLLGACGFRPVHAPGAAAEGQADIAAELAATRVAIIPERFGQLLRRGLQRRLETGGRAEPRWELQVVPSLSAEGIGIQRDGSATRVRYLATASWTLLRLAPRETAANGFERIIEAFNIQPNQFFAADASREASERRMAEALADEVVLRLAMRLRGLREGEAPQLIAPVAPPPVLPDPAAPQGLGVGGATPSPGVGGGLSGGIGPLDLPR